MNDLQNSILEAIQMISENTNSSSEKTITIKCQIKEIIDAGIGTYLVQYLDNSFTVYSSNANIQYSVGTNVYVLIPDGDFSQEKIIIGAVQPSADNYTNDSETVDEYYDISDNLLEDYGEIQLSSYETLKPNGSNNIIKFNESISTVLNSYLKDYSNFEFSFDVKTKLDIEQQVKGNYGATLAIPMKVLNEDGTGFKDIYKEYTLNVDNMLGNPYGFKTWTNQKIRFVLETDSRYSYYDTEKIPYITYFCYDFKTDKTKEEIKDIFLKNFSFKVVEKLNEEDSKGYKLTLKASGGEYFLNDTSKEIEPTLRINGKITSLNNKPHYWFIEDANIDSSSSLFVSYGGLGWRCLNDKINMAPSGGNEDEGVFDYNVKQYSYIANSGDTGATKVRYKCVVIYNNAIISSIITLKKIGEDRVSFYPTHGSNVFIKGAGYVDLTVDVKNVKEGQQSNIEIICQRFNEDGSFISNEEIVDQGFTLDKKFFRSIIKFPTILVEKSNLIRCSVFENKNFIGSQELFISVEEKEGYKLIVENGNKIYKYDADGDSPMIEAYDGPISSKIYGIEALSYRVYKPDGTELTDEEYFQCKYTWKVPKNSMIEVTESFDSKDDNYYYFSGSGNKDELPYGIARKYNRAKNDNNIILRVDFQGNLLDNIINLHFIKDGDSGTNGTKYSAILTVEGKAYDEPDENGNRQKLICIFDSTSSAGRGWRWKHGKKEVLFSNKIPAFSVRVYEDGELMQPSTEGKSNYIVTYSMFDSRITNPHFTFKDNVFGVQRGGDLSNSEYCNIVEAKITIKKNGNSSSIAEYSNTTLYAYYPIETIISNIEVKAAPQITGGFSQVLYGSDGFKPEWDTTYPFECGTMEGFTTTWGWGALNNLYIKSVVNNQCVVMPHEKYDNGNSRNFVKLTYTSITNNTHKIIYIHPVVFLLNRYGMSHINEWDGNKIYTGANDEYLLAPQVGAGRKENDNSFTGMVMGLRRFQDKNNSQVGLFGYHKGAQSLFLNAENGSAIFGKASSSGGQIIIDPSRDDALLYSNNYFKLEAYDSHTGLPNYSELNNQGMLINLSKANIKWGNGNFEVNDKGHITAKGGGTIAGWKVNDNTLKSKNDSIVLESTENGKIYSLEHWHLGSRDKGFYLGSDGISIGDSLLFTEADGSIKLGKLSGNAYWTINGTEDDNKRSYIAYGTEIFNKGTNSVYLGTDGISLGENKFHVNNEGDLTSKSGTIGGWTIGEKTLSANGIIINSDGELKGGASYNWSIVQDGTATFSNINATGYINATGGKIGGWTISDGNIFYGDVTKLNGATGEITTKFINITGGKIQLGNITIDGLDDTTGSTSAIRNTKIGSFTVDSNSIFKDSWGTNGATVFMCSGTSGSYTIAGHGSTGWAFGAGGKFGVLNNGSVYCSDIHATGGEIGGWNILSSGLSKTNNGIRVSLINDFTSSESYTPFLSSSVNSNMTFAVYLNGKIQCNELSVGSQILTATDIQELKALLNS